VTGRSSDDKTGTAPGEHPEEEGEGVLGKRTAEGGKEEEVKEDEVAAAAVIRSNDSSSEPQCRDGTMWSHPGTSSGSRQWK
jgi:hypothetical protein